MLKKIPVRQLRMGMHLHKLEGSWIDHPFWKTRFVIDDAADLRKLRACGVDECWIDVDLGLDVAGADDATLPTPAREPDPEPAQARPEAPPPLPRAGAAAAPAAPPRPPEPQTDLRAELKQAAAICNRGREAVLAMFGEARMGHTIDPETCLPLVEEISNSVARNAGALVSLARLKTVDDYSYMHSVAVCALMVALGRQLGFDEDACRAAGLAGLMHDIGKALMPLEVLNKPGRLTEEEFAIIRTHPERGRELLAEGGGSTAAMLDVVLHHHERVDGSGYPDKLSGEAFTQLARMGSVCDVYDAITSNRPYKKGWDPAESIARMASWKGHFDERIFGAFVRSLGIYPTGSLVRMASGRLAVVCEQNPANLVAPTVKVFFSTKTQLHITPTLLDLSRPGTTDRIVGREPRVVDGVPRFTHIDELWADPEALRRTR
ncbi:Phosphodiesterase [Rubrivivax sp. A210]|uniref:HD-GYP domain-containing protein n=1 Tax=Rubrivivax sp. A210 TaxID=2772301 RepID=UPI001919197F|nr:HD-GYP domain-containing protein [Rubrivivax sp. A210]CAD5372390.1 Phosphodiesterase [Rubrivivax sp. A210]